MTDRDYESAPSFLEESFAEPAGGPLERFCPKGGIDAVTILDAESGVFADAVEVAVMTEAFVGTVNSETVEKVLGIRLRRSGQVFFFVDTGHPVRVGTKVIVELEHGQALGEVASILSGISAEVPKRDILSGSVIRPATAQDIAHHTENSILTAEAVAFCKTCIRRRELDMKLVDVEVLHDRSKIIFFFTAPSRIDFRELVKDLVRNYRTRIELRQIGVRHETQMIGGIGNCGNVCCCHRFLRKFAPVTIKMAKEQNLFLNPAKLSGMCGRLLCCLSYEQSNYDEFNRRCPKPGKRYMTDMGAVKILRANMFNRSIICLSAENEEREFTLEEWERLRPRRAEQGGQSDRRADESTALMEQTVAPDEEEYFTCSAVSALEDEAEPGGVVSAGRGGVENREDRSGRSHNRDRRNKKRRPEQGLQPSDKPEHSRLERSDQTNRPEQSAGRQERHGMRKKPDDGRSESRREPRPAGGGSGDMPNE